MLIITVKFLVHKVITNSVTEEPDCDTNYLLGDNNDPEGIFISDDGECGSISFRSKGTALYLSDSFYLKRRESGRVTSSDRAHHA